MSTTESRDLEKAPKERASPDGSSDATLVGESEAGGAQREPKGKEDKDVELVDWDGDDDPACPLNWSSSKKNGVILSVAFAACSVTCCSSMIASTYESQEAVFGVSRVVATLGLSIFVFGLGLGPLAMGPLSELYGRRPIYLIGYGVFLCFNFGVAFAQNIGTLLICRFLDGLAGSAFLSVAGGSVSDCFRPQAISIPMAIFTLSVFLGPVLGPVFASAIVYHQDWRVVFYFQLAWCGLSLALLVILADETFAPPLLKQKAQRLRKESGNDRWRSQSEVDELPLHRAIAHSCYTPFALMLTEPMALLLSLWTALYLAIVYSFFEAFDVIYGAHGFNGWQIGESFWGIGIGTIIGAMTTPIFDRISEQRAEKTGKPAPLEEQLRKGIYGGLIAPFGLLVFAFTARPTISWVVSIVFSAFFGCGYFLIYQAVFSYLVAAYRPVSASAMALNSFLRSAAAGGLPLVVVQMLNALTITWGSALIAFVALAMAPIPVVFFKYGSRLRKKSKYSYTE